MSIIGSQSNTFAGNDWFVNKVFEVITNHQINGVDLGHYFVPPYVVYETSNSSCTIPSNVTYMNIISVGGGGGGGGGGAEQNGKGSSGGSGGAGAIGVNLLLPIISSYNTYSVTVGAGGSNGGAASTNGTIGIGTPGGDGGDGSNSFINYNSKKWCVGGGGNNGVGGFGISGSNKNNAGALKPKIINCTVNSISYDYDGEAGKNGGAIQINTDGTASGEYITTNIPPGLSGLHNLLNTSFNTSNPGIFYSGNGGYGGYGDGGAGGQWGAAGTGGISGIVIVFYYYTPIPTNYTIVNTSQ